jgi:hypothetical protein
MRIGKDAAELHLIRIWQIALPAGSSVRNVSDCTVNCAYIVLIITISNVRFELLAVVAMNRTALQLRQNP